MNEWHLRQTYRILFVFFLILGTEPIKPFSNNVFSPPVWAFWEVVMAVFQMKACSWNVASWNWKRNCSRIAFPSWCLTVAGCQPTRSHSLRFFAVTLISNPTSDLPPLRPLPAAGGALWNSTNSGTCRDLADLRVKMFCHMEKSAGSKVHP